MSFFSGVSNFLSNEPYDVFWQIGTNDPNRFIVCATNWYTLASMLQLSLRSVPSGQTYGGATVSGAMVTVDRRFGPMTAKVLYLAAKNAGADAATLAQMQREATLRGSGGMTTLLIESIRQIVRTSPSAPVSVTAADVRLPANVIPPRWGIASPAPTGWRNGAPTGMSPLRCTALVRVGDAWGLAGEDPAEPTTPAPAPAPPPPPPPPAPEHGGPPIPPAPPGPEDLPPGVTVRPVEEVGGVSWGVIGVGVATVVALSWLGLSLMKGPAAKNTQLRRPSRRRLAVA